MSPACSTVAPRQGHRLIFRILVIIRKYKIGNSEIGWPQHSWHARAQDTQFVLGIFTLGWWFDTGLGKGKQLVLITIACSQVSQKCFSFTVEFHCLGKLKSFYIPYSVVMTTDCEVKNDICSLSGFKMQHFILVSYYSNFVYIK